MQTAAWYRLRHEQHADTAAMLAFTREQINAYTQAAGRARAAWAT